MYHCLQGCKSETDGSMLFEAISFQSIHSFQSLFACFLSDSWALGGGLVGLFGQDYRDTEYQGYVNPKLYKRTEG